MQTGDRVLPITLFFIDADFDYRLVRQRFPITLAHALREQKAFSRKINQCLPSRKSTFFYRFSPVYCGIKLRLAPLIIAHHNRIPFYNRFVFRRMKKKEWGKTAARKTFLRPIFQRFILFFHSFIRKGLKHNSRYRSEWIVWCNIWKILWKRLPQKRFFLRRYLFHRFSNFFSWKLSSNNLLPKRFDSKYDALLLFLAQSISWCFDGMFFITRLKLTRFVEGWAEEK